MTIDFLDIVVIAVYLGGMAAMGIYFSRRNTTTEEYFVGGRSFSGWVVGISMVGTVISSITFLAYPGDAFRTSWIRFVPNFMLPFGAVIAVYAFLPFYRRGKIISAYQYLEGRFGPVVRVYGAVVFIIAQLVRESMILYLVSLVMHEMTGLNFVACIIIGGAVVAGYTIIGGIGAVIWTDVIQTIVLVIGGVISLIVIIQQLPGGLGQIISTGLAEGKLSFSELVDGRLIPIKWDISLQRKTGTMMLILGLTNWLHLYCSNQNTVQRYCASKSAHEARKAMFVCAFSSLPIWAFFMFLGTSLFVFFQHFSAPQAAAMLSGQSKAEQIFPFFFINYLPAGVTGLLIAAVLAAAMSSIDSSINAISTVGVVDIYRRHLVKGRGDRHYLKVARWFGCFAGVSMIVGAIILAYSRTKTLQDTANILVSLCGGGLLGMYLLGFLTKRGDWRSVVTGIVCTIVFSCWTVLSRKQLLPASLCAPFDLYYTGMIGHVVMFAVGYGASFLFPSKGRDLKNLTVYTQDDSPLE